MKILIIEDEKTLADKLALRIKSLRPESELVGIISSITKGKDFLSRHQDIDLIFSDIRLDDGLSFSIFDTVETSAYIIFTTAYDEFAIHAFEYNCIDYLLKPITLSALAEAFKKYEKRVGYRMNRAIFQETKGIITGERPPYRQRLLLEKGEELLVADIKDVAFFQADQGLVRVHLNNGGWGLLNLTLHKLSESLDPGIFFQANRQTIIQIGNLEKLVSPHSRHVRLVLKPPFQQVEISIPKEKAQSLLQLLEN